MRQPNNKKGPEGMAKVNKDVVKRLMSDIINCVLLLS